MNLDYHSIHYIIILDEHDSYTPFSGFGYNIVKESMFFLEMIKLPQDIEEVCLSCEEKLMKRSNYPSSYEITPIQIAGFKSFIDSPYLFNVCISSPRHLKDIRKVVKNWSYTPFHLQISNTPINPNDIRRKLYNHFNQQLKAIQKRKKDLFPEEFITNYKLHRDSEIYLVEKELETHNTTAMIWEFLRSNRVKFTKHSILYLKNNNNDYVEQIINWNNTLKTFLDQFEDHKPYRILFKLDIILTSPPIYREMPLFQDDQSLGIDNIKFQKLVKKFTKQKKYFMEISPSISIDSTSDVDLAEEMKMLSSLRREELDLYTRLMGLVLATKLCPIYRIQPEIDTGLNKELNDFISSFGKVKHSQCYKTLLDSISNVIPQKYLSQLPSDRMARIKIFSDGPIEFLRTNTDRNLPLFLEHSVCKIPMIPGNVFISTLLNDKVIEIPYSEICNVTIIRSYNKTDSIKYLLEKTCDEFFVLLKQNKSREGSNLKNNVHYKIYDVETISKMIEILNSIKSRIVIFDCHGSDNKNIEEPGWLCIGNEKFNIFEYKYKVRVPDIVILSACETHPIKVNYSSVANGFLSAGVKTILATNLPIEADMAAMFIARILFRINDYFPAMFRVRDDLPVSWLEYIGGIQKMTYLTEILRHFLGQSMIDGNTYTSIHSETSYLININQYNWFDILVEKLSHFASRDKNEITTIIDKDLGFCDSMKYILLGNADNIFIVSD